MSMAKLMVALTEPVDARVMATQDQMSTALKQLWQSGVSYESISVTQLCRLAHVARQTFYRRYDSMDEIFGVDTARMFNSLMTNIDENNDSLQHMAHWVVEVVYQYQDLFAEVTWSHNELIMVQTMTGGVLRVFSIRDVKPAHQAIFAEMVARDLLGFGQTVVRYPHLPKKDAEQMVTAFLPRLG